MKALEKERSRRYETANGLARDIERYLHDDPVEARPPSAGYRFSKFARRNKAALVTIGLVAAALVVGTMVSTWQAIRATRAEQVAQDERREAEKQRAQTEMNFNKAKAAVDEYFTLVSESKLFDVPGLQPLRKELLEAALRFYKSSAVERTDDPAVLAELAATHLRLSQIYLAIGRTDDSVEAMRTALDCVDSLRHDHATARKYEPKLAGFYKGLRWMRASVPDARDRKGLLRTLLRTEAMWKELTDRYPSEHKFRGDLVFVQTAIAPLLDLKDSFAYLRSARSLAEALAREHPDVPHYREDLMAISMFWAGLLFDEGRSFADVSLRQQAVQLGEELLAEFPDVPAHRMALAKSVFNLGESTMWVQPQEAQRLLFRAMELSESLVRDFPGEPAYQEVWVQATVAWMRCPATKTYDSKGMDNVSKVIDVLEAQIKEHPKDREARLYLAWAYRAVADRALQDGNGATVEKMGRRALALFDDLASDSGMWFWGEMGWSCRTLAENARRDGRLDEARKHVEVAADACARLAVDKNLVRRDGQKLAFALDILAERVLATGGDDEVNAARQSIKNMWDKLWVDRPQDRQAREQYASTSKELGDRFQVPATSEPFLRLALALNVELAKEFPGDAGHLEQTGHLYRHLGWLVRGKGQSAEARQFFEKAAAIFEKLAADKIPQRDGFYRIFQVDTLIHLAITSAAGGHRPEAVATARQCVELSEPLVSEFPGTLDYRQKMSWAVRLLAEQLAAAGQPQDAVQTCRRQISFCEKLQPDHPQVDFKPQLANAYLALSFSLTKSGAVDEAKQSWEKAVEMGLSDANALNEFAWNLVTARDVEPALAALAVQAAQQAAKVAPNDAMISNTLGVAQCRAGNWADAVGSLAKAEELAPGKYLAFNGFFLAMAHWQLDHKDEARTWYDRSVEWMEKNQPKNEELVRFRAEAEQLLDIPQPSPTPKDTQPGDPAKPQS
jgi:tetratricopeptide (TPR) repeat protein